MGHGAPDSHHRRELGLRRDDRVSEGGPAAGEAPAGLGLRLDLVTWRSPGPSREVGVDRDQAGARPKLGADTVDGRRMNDTSAIRDQHARTDVRAQNALSLSGLAVDRVLIGVAVPLGAVRADVVVGRLNDRQPGDHPKLQQERNGGGFPDPEWVAHPQHAGKVSAGDRQATRLTDQSLLAGGISLASTGHPRTEETTVNRWILACSTAALMAGASTDTAHAQERRQRTEAEARAAAERNRAERARQEFEAYDPVLFELIGRVFNTHHIPMDIYHGKRIRPVNC